MRLHRLIILILSICSGILLAVTIHNWFMPNFWDSIQNLFEEQLYSMYDTYPSDNSNFLEEFLLVDIDLESLQLRNRQFTRSNLAECLRLLSNHEPACLIVDLSLLDFRGDSVEDSSVAYSLSKIKNLGLTGLLYTPQLAGDLLDQKVNNPAQTDCVTILFQKN